LTSARYDHLLNDTVNPYPTDDVDEDGFDLSQPRANPEEEHPCLALKKLLSGGTFFYSADFDLTRRLQRRVADENPSIAIDSLDAGFLWNSYMVESLVEFRSRLSKAEKVSLDASRILTSAIRGFCHTITVPYVSAPFGTGRSGKPSYLTIISRLSCRRAGTRFNSRGMDDDGNVANFVESEIIFWSPSGPCFSYVQVRGSIPIFWEQTTGLIPSQQKISITRSPEATQPAFDKHFDQLERSYGAVHVVNLLSHEKSSELQLGQRYRQHIDHSPLNETITGQESEHQLLRLTEYDFHAETRGSGYEAASGIERYIRSSTDGFMFFMSEEEEVYDKDGNMKLKSTPVLQQEGVFRTNCLDCLDRTNLIQTMLSQFALALFLRQHQEPGTADFWARHRTLWADNGDTLSRIYAGTGALKSSFTRHGKMSLGGMLSDARKSATRVYVNNFADKGRQNTIDVLLGRLMGQQPVRLFDPVYESVQFELHHRHAEFTTTKKIHILVGTFNLNGKDHGIKEDLSEWLCPQLKASERNPEVVAIAFQEIVQLSPQQIMSTDPHRRQAWEEAVKTTLNIHAAAHGEEEYVLLRGGQLVGASLSVFVRISVLPYVKNVEGSIKKTGMSGMAGNKGAVAIRMDYASTSLCFVTAHLAAGFANYEERNRDYRTISQGLQFPSRRSIDDNDNVIWFGDFNYRIGLSNDRVRPLILAGELDTLYHNDQLNIQMTHGHVFRFYEEAPITFNPTYKFDDGTDRYDSSDKARVPAWTDRVLRKGHSLTQLSYEVTHLRVSDHRPVRATFRCGIQVVDEKEREAISSALFKKFRHAAPEVPIHRPSAAHDVTKSSNPYSKWWLGGDAAIGEFASAMAVAQEPIVSARNLWRGPDDWVKIERAISGDEASLSLRKPSPVASDMLALGRSHPPSRPAKPSRLASTPTSASALSAKPALPPSRRSRAAMDSLMDDTGAEELNGWEVLRPTV
jgi:endonuclease/exonuclease/phosphatase family metal-dependent hydrolase